MTEATQLIFPLRAVLRTFVASAIGVFASWLVRTCGVALDPELTMNLADSLTALVWVFFTSFATWVMTRPRVNNWLSDTILAPAPADYEPKRAEV